ncbi:MAG: hypothetical protein WC456_04045 [Patescibacteria group bacterium]
MKRLIILSLFLLSGVFFLVHYSQSQTKSYYSGDAVSFQGKVYVATTNSDSLELFLLAGNDLQLLAKVRPTDKTFNRPINFYDVKFFPQADRLFVYAISDFSLYKYELVGNQLNFVSSQKNTYWEWYNRVDKFGDYLVTVSDKGVKIWNENMEVIGGAPIVDKAAPYNLRAYNNNYVLDVRDNQLLVYSLGTGQATLNIPVNYKTNPGNRQAYQDADGNLYIVDDYYTKKFNLDGKLLGSFQHLDYAGYDVAASGQSDYIYFSNGVGVVKLDKATMKVAAYRFTGGLAGPRGWAMGLKVVAAAGDKIVVFNNANILVLDDKLNKIASFKATESEAETSTENLFLKLDRTFGGANAAVTLTGGGYFPDEELAIDFGGSKTKATADRRGRFTQKLTVPALAAKAVDIRVIGESSQLSYSIAFNIQ